MSIIIDTQPVSQLVDVGQAASLSVTAHASPTAVLSYQWYRCYGVNEAISGATSSTFSIPAMTTENSDIYQCSVSHGTDSALTNNVVLASSILDSIELNIASMIMSTKSGNGYAYTWGTVNEEDETIGDLPRAVINPTDSLADKEVSMDTVAGISSLDYTNEVMFTILVKGEMQNFSRNANFKGRSVARKALDDLKKLFGTNYSLNSSCDNILYVGSQIETIKRNDMQRPVQLRTIWKVIYSQDRQNPIQYAGS